jgi:hypothetical protein
MTIKEIEDYINTYRLYPDEYTGKRDNGVLRSMNSYYRHDVKTNMITRYEGRINNNGDFELVGLFKYPIDKPEDKIEIEDVFERSVTLYSKYILNKYNDMMIELNHESGVIGNGQNDNWNLRDMVSEVEYLRSLYYTKGHDRNKLRAEDPVLFNRQTSRLRYFIRTYKDHIGNLVAYTNHNSKYDN